MVLGVTDAASFSGVSLKFSSSVAVTMTGHAARHLDQLIVAHPKRRGKDHLIAGINQDLKGNINAMLRAAGRYDLRRCIIQTAVLTQALTGSLTQFHNARRRSITGFVLINGFHSRRFNIIRSIEIRFPCAKTDHINSIGFHLLEHGVNCQSRRSLNCLRNLRKCFHWVSPPANFVEL